MPPRLRPLLLVIALCLAAARPTVGDQPHWAYRPIARSGLPRVAAPVTTANAIDHFVARQPPFDSAGKPLLANRTTLIRRVTLDLIGLLPSPLEVSRFVDDPSPDAYQRLVDRLLASPHYGEHWARPWLDLCHYADSDGYLTDQLRPVAWRYRAWLVDALNQNLPFDEFTVEQLAGDLLPAATTRNKIATGFLRQTLSNREGGADPEEFRVKQVVDRTNMVGEIWLGLTVGCAQCHDHKYDAISQKEYYELYALLDGADEINIDAPLPGERQAYQAAWPEYQRRRHAILAPAAEQIQVLQRQWEQKLGEARDHPGQNWYWDRQWELVGLVWGGGLGEGQLEGWQILMLDPAKRTPRQRDRLLDYFLSRADKLELEQSNKLKLGELSRQLKQLKAGLPPVTRAATMMQTQNPRSTCVHLGGDFRSHGEAVTGDTLDILPPMTATRRDRLALARWLVDPAHPLTARVAVNRMWQSLFGRGLVATGGDFGTRGAAPSHPELLDWLAREFLHSGWDVKGMHRFIVTSTTYQQRSETAMSAGFSLQQRPLRLSAEQIRDSMLQASGLWDRRIGGPSVRPPQPDSVTEQGFDNTWNTSSGGDRYRRAVYTWVQRTSPYAMHITFDAPNPNHVCTERDRSNTPLQALTLLNDPVFYEGATALAARVDRECDGTDSDKIAYAFRLCLARAPTANELAILVDLLDHLRAGPASRQAWPALCSVLFNLHEFVTRS